MDHSLKRPEGDILTRIGNGLTRWVLGWGFLTFHATVFTICMIGMMLWNFYDSPNDIWVDEVFRRWGAVLAFHAIAVAAGLTAWRLIRAEQRALQAEDVQWQAPVQPVATAIPAQTTPAGWTQPVSPEAPVTPSSARQAFVWLQSADAAFSRALANSATWSTDIARRTTSSVSAGTSSLVARVRKTSTNATPNPMQTWPVSPAQHRPEDEEFISRFGGNGQTGSTNGSGADVVLDASSYASDERRANAVPMTKAPGQTWVQAATYSWNVPRPAAEANGVAASQNGRSAPPPDTSQTSEH